MTLSKRIYGACVLLLCLLCSNATMAATEDDLTKLEAQMLLYFDSNDTETFTNVTEKLKQASREAGDERLFYKAWGYQGIFEATHQYYQTALGIAADIQEHARENGSVYGEYASLHTEAMILLQKQDYDAAEKAFLRAVDFSHKHFPNESAGEDLQELMKIANHRKDGPTSVKYARLILSEPNVAPIHKGRALYRISQMAFNKKDTTEFNRIYNEMMQLKEEEGISTLKPVVEVNYCILNGDYKRALQLADQLDAENSAERKALIYHSMGDDTQAYTYMQLYKKICDSITLVSHGNVVANCYVQMNNERMQLEQHLLEEENSKLRNRLYMAIGTALILILLFIIWRWRRLITVLRNDNSQLIYERKDAERALAELNELSFYESKATLDLTTAVNPNQLCNRLADSAQAHCAKGVTTMFISQVSDDVEITTNADALKKMLTHLLNYSARYTTQGTIKLTCEEEGDNIRFSVSDTSPGLGNKPEGHTIGMFAEEGNNIRYVGMNFNICQSITRLLHGRIWHDVAYTEGTRFCVVIPKKP